MASNQQLSNALFSPRLEIQPAFTNLNGDFTLLRIEAPPEYRGVGQALSELRSAEAESGPMHVLARKIGALFERIIPRTPTLISAYGRRASEIAAAAVVSDPARESYGVFARRAGADATSLWAAATSGRCTIAVHLLACLLARIWDGPCAVSLWMEIIECRQRDVRAAFERGQETDPNTLIAVLQEITRDQVSAWDASARAWLRVADKTLAVKQRQLDLIIDNLQCSVNSKLDTYSSVITAWESALKQMEGLLQGVAQRAQRGDVLLALSAWHLYPNMTVLKPTTVDVFQHDPLVPESGILTIGMDLPDKDAQGVYWSLPLSYLRRYGRPVQSTGSLSIGTSTRLTRDEWLMATLGCFLDSWKPFGMQTHLVIEWLSWLGHVLHHAANEQTAVSAKARSLLGTSHEASWLKLITDAAQRYEASTGTDRAFASKLLLLGYDHSKSFIPPATQPLFDLMRPENFLRLLKTEDDRVEYLREIAKSIQSKYRSQPRSFIIRYRRDNHFEFASGIPFVEDPMAAHEGEQKRHVRFLYAGGALPTQASSSYWDWCEKCEKQCRRQSTALGRKRLTLHRDETYERPVLRLDDQQRLGSEYHARQKQYYTRGEIALKCDEHCIDDLFPSLGIGGPESEYFGLTPGARTFTAYEFVHGDPWLAGLYYANSTQEASSVSRRDHTNETARLFYSFAKRDRFDRSRLVAYLDDHFRTSFLKDEQLPSLRAIATAAHIYHGLPDATIDVRVLSNKLRTARWMSETGEGDPAISPSGPPSPSSSASRRPSPSPTRMSRASSSTRSRPSSIPRRPSMSPPPYSLAQSRAPSPERWDRLRRVDASVLGSDTPWSLRPYTLTLMQVFACILMFESGGHNVPPHQLRGVMALSTGNSLFVGATLLCDPWEEPRSTGVRHIAGNVGRPGIAALIPPADPMVSKFEVTDWRNLGRLEDSSTCVTAPGAFADTTMHLAFTGRAFPLHIGTTVVEDPELYLLETLVSVYDKGTWVADLDVYAYLDPSSSFTRASPRSLTAGMPPRRHPKLTLTSTVARLRDSCSTHHRSASPPDPSEKPPSLPTPPHHDAHVTAADDPLPFVRLDTWASILGASRAHVNVVAAPPAHWQARLAAATVCAMKGYRTYLAPPAKGNAGVCWACVRDKWESGMPVVGVGMGMGIGAGVGEEMEERAVVVI